MIPSKAYFYKTLGNLAKRRTKTGMDGTWWALMKLFHRESNTNYLDLGHCLKDWWQNPVVRPGHIVPKQPQDLRVAVCCGTIEAVQRALDEGAARKNPNRKILKNRWVEFQKGRNSQLSVFFCNNMEVGLLNYHEFVPKFGNLILDLNQVGQPIPCDMLGDDCKNTLNSGCIFWWLPVNKTLPSGVSRLVN